MNARIDAVDAQLRERARLAVQNSPRLRSVQEIWEELTGGCWRVVDAFQDDAHCYLVLRTPAVAPPRLSPRERRILEHVLRGNRQKPIAIDLGLSYSTVATIAKQALSYLGLDCIPSRVPLSLVVAAQARKDIRPQSLASFASLVHRDREYRVVNLLRPDSKLPSLLPPAEVEVVRARLEGQSHGRIAGLRRTSPRTVANQLASAARRLGVSGRLETINLLLTA